MAALERLLEYATLAVSLGLLTFGVTLLRVFRHRGGMDLELAHLVADDRRRRTFFAGLFTSLVALFALGLLVSLELIVGAPSVVPQVTEMALFVAGSMGILILMANALRVRPLTLQEGWNLQETAARATMVPNELTAGGRWADPRGAGEQDPQASRRP
jgi:hypothetical protein